MTTVSCRESLHYLRGLQRNALRRAAARLPRIAVKRGCPASPRCAPLCPRRRPTEAHLGRGSARVSAPSSTGGEAASATRRGVVSAPSSGPATDRRHRRAGPGPADQDRCVRFWRGHAAPCRCAHTIEARNRARKTNSERLEKIGKSQTPAARACWAVACASVAAERVLDPRRSTGKFRPRTPQH